MSLKIMFIFFLYGLTLINAAPTTTTANDTDTIDLITKSCEGALNVSSCVSMLYKYTYYIDNNPNLRQVAKLSVAICIKATNYTQKIMDQNLVSLANTALKDNLEECGEHMSSSFDNLRSSLLELKKSGQPNSKGYAMSMSNLMTWLSAALTDVCECKDLLSDTTIGENRTTIRAYVADVNQKISNALAVCNKLAQSSSSYP